MSRDNIISFISDISNEQKHKNTNPVITQNLEVPPMILGEWEYSCPSCGTEQKFKVENMVFRTAEFFCSNCGSLHRITNPGFLR